jgi:hypothetical protein
LTAEEDAVEAAMGDDKGEDEAAGEMASIRCEEGNGQEGRSDDEDNDCRIHLNTSISAAALLQHALRWVR